MAEPLVIFFLTLHDAGIFYRLGIVILTDGNAFVAQLAVQAWAGALDWRTSRNILVQPSWNRASIAVRRRVSP